MEPVRVFQQLTFQKYKIPKRVTPVPKEGGQGFYLQSELSILELSLLEPEHTQQPCSLAYQVILEVCLYLESN